MQDTVTALSRASVHLIERCILEFVPNNSAQGYLMPADVQRNVAECLQSDHVNVTDNDVGTVLEQMLARDAVRLIAGRVHPPLDSVENDW